MSKKTQQIPKQQFRALIDKGTINKDAKQFDIVFATETPVFRRGWDENYFEILSVNKDNMRTERLDSGIVPLLDNHDKYTGVTKQYGVIISWDIQSGEARATCRTGAFRARSAPNRDRARRGPSRRNRERRS